MITHCKVYSIYYLLSTVDYLKPFFLYSQLYVVLGTVLDPKIRWSSPCLLDDEGDLHDTLVRFEDGQLDVLVDVRVLYTRDLLYLAEFRV